MGRCVSAANRESHSTLNDEPKTSIRPVLEPPQAKAFVQPIAEPCQQLQEEEGLYHTAVAKDAGSSW